MKNPNKNFAEEVEKFKREAGISKEKKGWNIGINFSKLNNFPIIAICTTILFFGLTFVFHSLFAILVPKLNYFVNLVGFIGIGILMINLTDMFYENTPRKHMYEDHIMGLLLFYIACFFIFLVSSFFEVAETSHVYFSIKMLTFFISACLSTTITFILNFLWITHSNNHEKTTSIFQFQIILIYIFSGLYYLQGLCTVLS